LPSFPLEIHFAAADCHIVVRNSARFNDYDGNNPEKVEQNRIQANSGSVIRTVIWIEGAIGSTPISSSPLKNFIRAVAVREWSTIHRENVRSLTVAARENAFFNTLLGGLGRISFYHRHWE